MQWSRFDGDGESEKKNNGLQIGWLPEISKFADISPSRYGFSPRRMAGASNLCFVRVAVFSRRQNRFNIPSLDELPNKINQETT